MKKVAILTDRECRELEHIALVLMHTAYDFEWLTDKEDGCKTIEELKERMSHDMEYLDKAKLVIDNMLSDTDSDVTVSDFGIE